MSVNNVEIDLRETPSFSEHHNIKINGVPIGNVTSLKIEASAGDLTLVTVSFFARVDGQI